MQKLTTTKVWLTALILSLSYLSPAQEEDWIRVYGDERSNVCQEIIETYDHGYLIGGHTKKYNGTPTYALLIKTDINGEVLWEKRIGANPSPGKTGGSLIKQTPDGGYIVSGATWLYDVNYDAFMVKLNACGEKEWSKIFYNMGSPEYGVGVEVMDDGSYLAMIRYWGDDLANERIWLFKIAQDGEILWQKVYAKWTLGTNDEDCYHLTRNDRNEYLITGGYYQYNPGSDTMARYVRPMFIQVDSLGNEQWHLLWGVNDYFYGAAYNSTFNSKGNLYSAGRNASADEYSDRPVLFKISKTGTQVYSKDIVGQANGGGATTISLLQDSILFIGATWQDLDDVIHNGILKTDTLGNIIVQKDLLDIGHAFNSSIITYNNKYLVAGSFYIGGNWDIYLWKFNRDLKYDSIYTRPFVYDSLCPYGIVSDTIDLDTTTVNLPELYEQMHRIKVYPNPANEKIIITLGDLATGDELLLYNTNGQVIRRIKVNLPNRSYEMNVEGLPSGLYVIMFNNKGETVERKKVIVKNN